MEALEMQICVKSSFTRDGHQAGKLTVFSQHHHDLRVGELSTFDLQCELAHGLLHFWILRQDRNMSHGTSSLN